MANKKHIRLNSLRDVQKFLAKLANERYRDESDSSKCRDLTYLTKVLFDSIIQGDLEKRIEALEQTLKERGKTGVNQ